MFRLAVPLSRRPGPSSGLALLPGAGRMLATVIISLLITRTTAADPWPDAALIAVGSNVVSLLVKAHILDWT